MQHVRVRRESGLVRSDLPVAPSAERHVVQLYEQEELLCESVASFTAAGLRAGEPALLIVSDTMRARVFQALSQQGWDVQAERALGLLSWLDAAQLMGELFVGEQLELLRFRERIAAALHQLSCAAPGRPARIYGELTQLLWREGRTTLALALEAQWNALREVHAFSLLCAYPLSGFPDHAHGALFAEVCDHHDDVLPAESYSLHDEPGVRLRQVAMLQQRAQALESQLSQQASSEQSLRDALRAGDEFLIIASHELRTPLTALSLSMQNLGESLAQGEHARSQDELLRCAAQLKRLRGLVEQLLDGTGMRAGRVTLQREQMGLLGAVHDGVAGQAEAAARTGSQLRVLAADEVFGYWDATRIDQVITNLLSNAIKYGRGKPIEVRVRQRQDKAILSVRDQGIGISREDHARIFGRFERAASANGVAGLGLGLWVVQQIVEAHGGHISVESEPSQGTTFTVELPLGQQ